MTNIKIETRKRKDGTSIEFIVARDDKGKLINSIKKTPEMSLERAKNIYSKNNTFDDSLTKIRMKNFSEFTYHVKPSYSAKNGQFELLPIDKIPRKRGQFFVQWEVSLHLKNGKTVVARSMKYDDRTSAEEQRARNEAWSNVMMRLAQAFGLEYEETEGEQIFENKIMSVDEGKVMYVPNIIQRKSPKTDQSTK